MMPLTATIIEIVDRCDTIDDGDDGNAHYLKVVQFGQCTA